MSANNWAICPKCKDNGVEESTFREDYELGVLETGEFYVIYSGYCRACDLKHEFKHSRQIFSPKKVNP